jgi:hypothetical protein
MLTTRPPKVPEASMLTTRPPKLLPKEKIMLGKFSCALFSHLDFLTFDNGTDRLPQNADITTIHWVISHKSAELT